MAIDPITATAAVSLVTPYLRKMAEGVAEKLGETAADAGSKILDWMRSKLVGRARDALDDLEKAPESEDNQADLRKQLTILLNAEPALAEELHALIPREAIEKATAMHQVVSGRGAKAQQIHGTGNTSNIS